MKKGEISFSMVTMAVLMIFAVSSVVPVTTVAQSDKTTNKPQRGTKKVSVKCGEGVMTSIVVVNSGKHNAFGCVLWGVSSDKHKDDSIWLVTTMGKPFWDAALIGLVNKDPNSATFEWFCNRSESNNHGVWSASSTFIGPKIAKKVAVRCADTPVDVVMGPTTPAKPK